MSSQQCCTKLPKIYEYQIVCKVRELKKCLCCGEYFNPKYRSDTIYCDRVVPNSRGKTCKQVGAQRSFEEKLKNNKVEKLCRNIYQAKQMRVRRNPDVMACKEDFEKWKTEVRVWKADMKKGVKSSEEFQKWLMDNH